MFMEDGFIGSTKAIMKTSLSGIAHDIRTWKLKNPN